MKLERTEEQQLVVDTIRSLVRNEVRPLEADLDPEAYTLPAVEEERLSKLVKDLGFHQPDVPEAFGGPGLDLVTRALVAEEMSQHRAGISAPCYDVFGVTPPLELFDANDEQRERYLVPSLTGERRGFSAVAEEGGGSDPAHAVQTTALRDGDHWVLNGRKTWISGLEASDFAVVHARTDPMKDRDGVSAFLVDLNTPGVEADHISQMVWSRHTTDLVLNDVRVPAANLIGNEGGGLGLASAATNRRLIVRAGVSVGVGVYASQLAIDWARDRMTFGEPLANRQAIQWMLVDNEIEMQSARWITLDAAYKGQTGRPFAYEASMAKLNATEAATRAVDRSMQIFGGLGMAKDMPLERWYRELRVLRIIDGPSELHRVAIANRLFRRDDD